MLNLIGKVHRTLVLSKEGNNLYPFFKMIFDCVRMRYSSMFWEKIVGKTIRKRVQFVTQPYIELVPKLPKIQISWDGFRMESISNLPFD